MSAHPARHCRRGERVSPRDAARVYGLGLMPLSTDGAANDEKELARAFKGTVSPPLVPTSSPYGDCLLGPAHFITRRFDQLAGHPPEREPHFGNRVSAGADRDHKIRFLRLQF